MNIRWCLWWIAQHLTLKDSPNPRKIVSFGKTSIFHRSKTQPFLQTNAPRTVCITREEKDQHDEKRMRISHKHLRRVLLQPGVGGKPIAIISIAGESRGGKSFLLNYILRYLREKGVSNSRAYFHLIILYKIKRLEGMKNGSIAHLVPIERFC